MSPIIWIVLGLLAAFLFALVHVMDSYCVEGIFDRPWMGMITSSVASLIVFVPLPFLMPFLQWHIPPWQIVAFALLAGACIQLSQALYFQSLSYSEAGIVSAYWNMIPAIIPLMSFILLHEVLSFREYTGIAVLIMASTYLLLLDSSVVMRMRSFLLMLVACILQSCAYLLLDQVFVIIPYLQGFVLMTAGLVITGMLPLLFHTIRKQLVQNLPSLLPNTFFFLSIEIINLLALAAAQKAVDIGTPSLTSGIETTMPGFVLILSLIGCAAGWKIGDSRTRIRLPWKLSAVGIMAIGVLLLS